MSKGKIIFFDDESDIINQFEKLMAGSGFEIVRYTVLDDLKKDLDNVDLFLNAKALIFDLAKNKSETKDFEILKHIEQKFNEYRIPIFIHSAFANQISEFENKGTVWKIEKSGTSLEEICDTISVLDESGFIEAFTPGGIIEQGVMQELHKNFTEQFRRGEIEKIIESIKKSNPDDYKNRSINMFKRIAIRALMSELLVPVAANDDTINPIEHFYRRSKTVPIWTGDIWRKKDNSESIIVLTPRCDLAANKSNSIITCAISAMPVLNLSGNNEKRLKQLQDHLTDNLLGKAMRYLPSTPLYEGGMVDLANHRTIEKQVLFDDYDYVITLSDELTNEIIGKFAYYFLRTGITTMNAKEFDAYLDILKETLNVQK
jgi:hypothetical protein